jgi:hypothetical protein
MWLVLLVQQRFTLKRLLSDLTSSPSSKLHIVGRAKLVVLLMAAEFGNPPFTVAFAFCQIPLYVVSWFQTLECRKGRAQPSKTVPSTGGKHQPAQVSTAPYAAPYQK